MKQWFSRAFGQFDQWFSRIMHGRYGQDGLYQALLIAALIFYVLFIALRWSVFYTLAMLVLLYAFFRALSRNTEKRRQELHKFEALRDKVKNAILDLKDNFDEWRIRHF